MTCIQRLESAGSTLEVVLLGNGPGVSPGNPWNFQRNSSQKQRLKLAETYPHVPVVNIQTAGNVGITEVVADDSRKIRSQRLDFILNFSPQTLQGEVLTASRYGVWTFRHGLASMHGLECFWDVYDDKNVTPAVLERAEQVPNRPEPLWTGHFRTIRSSYSRNLDNVLRGSSEWPAKILMKIRAGNIDPKGRAEDQSPLSTREAPTRWRIFVLQLKTAKRRLEAAYRLVFRYTTWNVGIVNSPIQEFLNPRFRPDVTWLPQPRNGHIQADPFGRVKPDGELEILFERLDYLHRKGIICAVGFGNDTSRPVVAIEEAVHMSYPCLFEYQGDTYCIPETNQAREVAVYKSIKFPSQWERTEHRLLSGIRAIDTTLFRHGDYWWLMCTDRDRGGDANLYAWYSTDIWGPWRPHLLNPVKTDVRSARPGGTPFESDGHLYRPAQDCSRTGGGQIIINRIETLTPTQFCEVPVATIGPFRDSVYKDGMHTLSAAGNYTLVDGKRFKFVPTGLLSNLARGIGRIRKRRSPTKALQGQ